MATWQQAQGTLCYIHYFSALRPEASYGSCRHDGDIIISFGRLVFWLLETRIVAKAAYRSSASDRLLHEFAVYNLLYTLQGVVIPSLFGLYRNLDDGSSILVTSYAGVTLEDFDALSLPDRKILLLRVARLHQMGVLHNDLEPRNVVFSKRSGPRIIDFDSATLGHTCTGLSCKELYDLAHRLRLDLGAELSRPEPSRPTRFWFLVTSVYVFIFFILSMAMYRVRYTA
ncbi:RIO-like kinase [Mycena sanguinolenta]|uniref:RIO-like kinase n=1 Tax=Mycena sanguinolenta TaxID=230812 RepID=A0A8H6WRU7_9AGAR|nr:RIO-like kinase [Mycena sanguinolenta]